VVALKVVGIVNTDGGIVMKYVKDALKHIDKKIQTTEEILLQIGNYSENRMISRIGFPISPRVSIYSCWAFPFDGKLGALAFESIPNAPKMKGYITFHTYCEFLFLNFLFLMNC
jgi:hypothetical protein